MTPSKSLPSQPSFESLRKQAKKLARQCAAGDPEALTRVHAQLPAPSLPLSLQDAQLVLAREYGFAGWQDLRTAVLRQEGRGLEWAAAEAERAIHDNCVGRLAQLVREYPALLSWRDDSGESLLAFATGSFGDSGDPFREQMFTRIECAAFLLDAGATVESSIWQGAIQARAKGVLQLLSHKGVLPRNLDTLAALGDYDGVRDLAPKATPVIAPCLAPELPRRTDRACNPIHCQLPGKLYRFAPKASNRPSQSFTTNSREFQGMLPSPRTNSTPRAAYSA